MDDLKKCKTCKKTKSSGYFYNPREGECRECRKKRSSEWRKNNPDKKRKADKKWRQENKIKIAESEKEYSRVNRSKLIKYRQEWRKNNPAKEREYNIKSHKKSYEKNRNKLSFIISNRMRANIFRVIKEKKNNQKWEKLIGYPVLELMKHLEKQFKDGMNWENYGEWHIDHIIPVSIFNFTKPEHEDFKKCWALKNLQPLWAVKNLSKGNKLNKQFQPSLAF